MECLHDALVKGLFCNMYCSIGKSQTKRSRIEPLNHANADFSPSPAGPHSAKRSSPPGKLTRGGLGKPLGWGEGERFLYIFCFSHPFTVAATSTAPPRPFPLFRAPRF